MSDIDEVAGVFDAIDTEATAHDPIEEVSTEPVAEGADSTTETEETEKTNTESSQEQSTEEVETQGEATSDKGQAQTETETTETKEPLQTETQTEAVVDNWQEKLPPPPVGYQGPEPQIDPETGQIVNMTPLEYATYLRESTKAELKQEDYRTMVENAALDAAEKILPEIKTNPAVRTMVENARVASVLTGQQIDTVTAAKQVREALGIAPAQLTQAKAQGAANAKASITVQKNAALETGSAQVVTEDPTDNLVKRVNRGDDDAFAELLGAWEDQGII